MTEILLEKESNTDTSEFLTIKSNVNTEETSSKNNLFEFDIIADTLKHIYSKSKIRKKLSSALSTFYSYPLLIFFFSFLIGLLFFGLSMLFIFLGIFKNFMIPVIVLIFLSLLFSILIIIIHVVDDLKNKISIGDKWERKNILKNFGLSLTLIVLVVGAFLFHKFFNKIISYNKNNNINIEYNKSVESNFKYDFIFEYVIYCFLIDDNETINEKNNVYINFSNTNILKNLHRSFIMAFIPLFIFCTTKIIKTTLLKVKYTFAKFIVFINLFCLIILIFVSHRFYDKNNFKWSKISLIEIILLSLIYFGYIIWIASSVYKLNKNPKDKNFAIYKYDLGQLLLIFTFDIINLFGTSLIYISFLVNYISYNSGEIEYKYMKTTLFCLKIGFLLSIISNSYYYGHHLLALIFRPIALKYAPSKLKQNYIRVNRKISLMTYSKYD